MKRNAPLAPSPTGDLLKATPYPIPQARTPTPELIQVCCTFIRQRVMASVSLDVHYFVSSFPHSVESRIVEQRKKHYSLFLDSCQSVEFFQYNVV